MKIVPIYMEYLYSYSLRIRKGKIFIYLLNYLALIIDCNVCINELLIIELFEYIIEFFFFNKLKRLKSKTANPET